MAQDATPPFGSVTWLDLTVPHAEKIRDFYSSVAGWRSEPVNMGGYADFEMRPPAEEKAAAGICHARGINAGLPAQWLIYIRVENLKKSIDQAERHGGHVVREPRKLGDGQMAVIRDPAGAVCALYEIADTTPDPEH